MKNFSFKFNIRLAGIFSVVLLVIAVFGACVLIDTGQNLLEVVGLAGGGCTYAVMAAVGNINRSTDKETSGSQIVSKVWLIALDQLDDTVPFPKPNGAGELATIPLKAGEYMHYFEAVDNSLEDKSTGAKGDITTAVTNTFSFIMGGNKAALLKFLEDHPGDRFIIIYQLADDRTYHVLGSDIKPMILKSFDRVTGKDSRSTSLAFENNSFEQPKKYIGAIVKQDPTQLAADATTIAFTSAPQYVTAANTVPTAINAFTGLTSLDEGRLIEVKGGGGPNASTIAEVAGIVLKGSETWIGNLGSSIIFRVLDAATLVEVSRTQSV